MTTRSVAVNFSANTVPYVAGVGAATKATTALSGAATLALAKIAGPAALVYGISQAAKASLAFTDEMTKLQTQIGLTSPEIADMRRAALGLGGETTKAPQELAEAVFFVASAGLRGADALDVLRASARLSAIGLGETKVIADLLTSAVNAYGSATLSASDASDALVAAVRLGKLEAPQLSAAMGSILPVASAMGVSFGEVAGMMAAMSRTGTDAATASTQLTQIMMGLMRPSNQATQALHDLGLTSEELRAVIQEDGLFAALMMLHDAVDGNVQALGEVFPNIRAFKGVADLLGPGLEANAEILREMAESTGVASDAFAEFSQTTRAEMGRLSAELQRAQIAVGDQTEGIIFQLSRALRTSVQAIGDAAERSSDRMGFTRTVAVNMAQAVMQVEQATRGLSRAEREAALESDAMRLALREVTEQYGRLTSAQQADAFSKDVRMGILRGTIGLDAELTEKLLAQARALGIASTEQAGLNADAERYTRLAESIIGATDGSTSAFDELAASLGMTREQMDAATRSIDENRRAQLALVDPAFAAVRAQRAYREALDAVATAQTDVEATADDLLDAVFSLMVAEIERQAAMEAAGLVTDGFNATLMETIETLGLEQAQIETLLGLLGDYGIALDGLDGRTVTTTHVHNVVTVGSFEGPTQVPVPGQLEFRARGGPIMAGRPYIVGEEGPELIVPSGAGRVMSAPQTQAMLGGSTYNVSVHMPPGADGDQVVSALRRWERSNGPIPVGVR